MGSENAKMNRKKDNQSSGAEVTKGQVGLDRKVELLEKPQPNVQLTEEKSISGIESTGVEKMEEQEGGVSYNLQELVSKYLQMKQNVGMLEESHRQMLSTLNKVEDKYYPKLGETVGEEKEQGTNTEVVLARSNTELGMAGTSSEVSMTRSNTEMGVAITNTGVGMAGTSMEMDMAGTETEVGIAGTNMERCKAGNNTKMDIAEIDIQELVTSVESFNEKLKVLLQDNSNEQNDISLSAFCEELSLEQLKAIRKDVSQIYGHVTEYLVSRSSQVGMVTVETIMDQRVNVYNLPGYLPKYHLTKSHKKFSRTLKRRNTLRSHDNRIALHYDMETVEGCVTHSEDRDEKKKNEDLGVASGCDMGIRDSRAVGKSVNEREDHKVTGYRNPVTASKGLAKKGSVWKKGQVVGTVAENEECSDSQSLSKSKMMTEASDTNGSKANKEHEETYKNCFFESVPLALVDVDKVRAQAYQIEENEVKLVDEAYWTQRLQEAVSNGSDLKSSRGTGFDTVLLVDISASMGKERWIQTITFLHNFLDGIESSQNYLSGAYEYISLVVFGHETRVVQHLTCDYVSLRKHLECLYPSGPSPLAAGVAMCSAALEAAGHVYSCRQVTVYPRILLVTDGCPTDTFRITGPDTASNNEKEQEKQTVLNMFKKLRTELNIRVYPIPIGDSDKDYLQMIASATKGKVVSAVNWRKLSNYQKQVDICCKLAAKKMNPLFYALHHAQIEDAENASSADMEVADELLHEHQQREREAKEEEDEENEFSECDPNMPPLGTRVARGPNWCWDIQDSNGFGTVIGHRPKDLKGWISVKWDQKDPIGSDEYNYRYGADGAYDILPVNEPRLLQLEEKIAVGCIVKRGKDWEGENQDGGPGNTGVVLKVYKKGQVKVRWENGIKENYRFGCEEKYDVELCNSFEVSSVFEGGGKRITLDDIPKKRSNSSRARKTSQSHPVVDPTSSTPAIKYPPSSGNKSQSINPDKEKSNVSTLENPASTRSGKHAPAVGKNPVPRKKIVPQSSMGKETTKQLSNTGIKAKEVCSLQEKTHSVQQSRQNLEKYKEKGCERASQRVTEDTRTSGANPKSNGQSPLVQMSEMTDHSVVWQWRKPNGHWISYEQEISQQLENRFQKNPGSSITINHQNQMFRVVFSRMQQLNTTTREWTDVQRLS
ncbi:hypothetical protein CHS0354_027911 [Potamilus streckersoni]|uniref:E3 ubiquitin-protein ligase HERC2 n=1 Tax=Potamilus streckersoni TaxID=2493646 RepID=A0AAE0T432_9BIVA|nr:hypothetical protein CHS0354_027911 [Potamilus streckersoni]